jgi:hypothetical protein
MLKRIPKSDISVRPFKAYKEWSFASGSTQISVLEANISSSELSGLYPKNSIYGQLKAQFYNGLEDNPFVRYGEKTNVYNTDTNSKERFLSGSAKILSIPQIYVGEGIKKGSVRFVDNAEPYIDDNYGNLVSETGLSEVDFVALDLSGSLFYFTSAGKSFTASIDIVDEPWFADIESGSVEFKINGKLETADINSIDIEAGVMYVKNSTFLPSLTVGNVFYNQGLMVFTRNLGTILNSNWDVSYKSTKTIYEHEYLLIVEQDEFNVSQNPSAVVEVGKETEIVSGSDGKFYKTITNPGVKYIRKKSTLENGTELDYRYTSVYDGVTKAGFEHYFLSSSVDSTGSFLTPFITTIGLYDDNCDLVAVAKLPQPIKSEHDIPVNFIVRFDT